MFLLFILIPTVLSQKLIVVVVDGLPGSIYHRFSSLNGFRTFEEEGIWSTKLFPVFPTLSLPNRHSLNTGMLPRKHGIIGEYMYNSRTAETFENFKKEEDSNQSMWWSVDPIYITAAKAMASVSLYFFPECKVDWNPPLSHCIPPSNSLSFANESAAKAIVQATKVDDLVMVYHSLVGEEVEHFGPNKMNLKTGKQIHLFQQSLERLTAEVRERIDLNLMVISTHGMTDVEKNNVRVLDDYIPMELINMTVGSGALKQIIAMNGKTHQVFTQLRHHNPIPNVKIYYTASKIGDMPEWYHYKKSAVVADLVLIAQPGYSITTLAKDKEFPSLGNETLHHGMSGYNNQYPDMLGVFLAYGPLFKKGYRKPSVEICDIYYMMCSILNLPCHHMPRRLLRIDDIMTSDARVAMRRNTTSPKSFRIHMHFVILITMLFL